MNTRTFDSVVNRQEAEALKELIFKRAQERTSTLSSQANESYTTNIRNDVMELARESFVAQKNPFSFDKIEKTQVHENSYDVVKKDSQEFEGLGFEQRKAENIKAEIEYKNKIVDENITKLTIDDNMTEARNDFAKHSGFMGALEFLNSQATVALVRSKGKSFDAIA